MPYIKQGSRPRFNPIIKAMVDKGVRPNKHLKDILFMFCALHVKSSYNNYKNFCGELHQCAKEIKRRRVSFGKAVPGPSSENLSYVTEIIQLMADVGIEANGDLNYVLFGFCRYHVESPEEFCSVLLETAEEIEQDLLAPYEDEKIKENGDV